MPRTTQRSDDQYSVRNFTGNAAPMHEHAKAAKTTEAKGQMARAITRVLSDRRKSLAVNAPDVCTANWF